MTEFYVSRNGQSEGPYTKGEVLDRIHKGIFSIEDLVWKTGDSSWRALSAEFPSLYGMPTPPRSSVAVPSENNETFAALALILPIAGTMLNIFWVGSMNLLQSPMSALTMVSAFVVIGSAVFVSLDAIKLGIGGQNDPAVIDGKKVTPPVGWGIAIALLWAIIFPVYMYWRSRLGAKSYMLVAIIGVFAFSISALLISAAIEKQKEQVTQGLENLFGGEQNVNSLGEMDY